MRGAGGGSGCEPGPRAGVVPGGSLPPRPLPASAQAVPTSSGPGPLSCSFMSWKPSPPGSPKPVRMSTQSSLTRRSSWSLPRLLSGPWSPHLPSMGLGHPGAPQGLRGDGLLPGSEPCPCGSFQPPSARAAYSPNPSPTVNQAAQAAAHWGDRKAVTWASCSCASPGGPAVSRCRLMGWSLHLQPVLGPSFPQAAGPGPGSATGATGLARACFGLRAAPGPAPLSVSSRELLGPCSLGAAPAAQQRLPTCLSGHWPGCPVPLSPGRPVVP